MTYYYYPTNEEMTYEVFCLETCSLADLISEHKEILDRFFQLTRSLQGWDAFFNQSITITEVNNPNMGHIYLGKIRIPVAFSKKRDNKNNPIAHIITFRICRYEEMPGDDFKEERLKIGREKALEKLKFHYPEHFEFRAPVSGDEEEEEGDTIDLKTRIEDKINTIRSFKRRWDLVS
jgi:hypothetical protein